MTSGSAAPLGVESGSAQDPPHARRRHRRAAPTLALVLARTAGSRADESHDRCRACDRWTRSETALKEKERKRAARVPFSRGDGRKPRVHGPDSRTPLGMCERAVRGGDNSPLVIKKGGGGKDGRKPRGRNVRTPCSCENVPSAAPTLALCLLACAAAADPLLLDRSGTDPGKSPPFSSKNHMTERTQAYCQFCSQSARANR